MWATLKKQKTATRIKKGTTKRLGENQRKTRTKKVKPNYIIVSGNEVFRGCPRYGWFLLFKSVLRLPKDLS